MKYAKLTVAVVLIAALTMGLLSGCGSAAKDVVLEPYDMEWGITREEAAAQLKCAYYTNEKSTDCIYVANAANGDALQAFGAAPSLIIYEFSSQNSGRLSKVIYQFSEDDYDQLLANLDQMCGQRYFEKAIWGTADANVYLFENGSVCIEYSDSPIADPKTVSADNRDRYQTLTVAGYFSVEKTVTLSLDNYALLWKYSTAETDFVLTDNRQ